MLGVMLINLGTPAAPTTGAVRRYLREFLSDRRVIDIDPVSRALLVGLVIAPFRAPKSARAYQAVWMAEGSPLMVHSEVLAEALAARMGQGTVVALAMRYGQPSIAEALSALSGCARIVVVPLYPQYASSSTGTALEQLYDTARRALVVPPLAVVPAFFDQPAYIAAVAAVAAPHIADDDHVLLSFHGLPVRQLPCAACPQDTPCPPPTGPRANCYRAQSYASAAAIAAALDLPDGRWEVSFQSRMGRTPWIEPFTDVRLDELAESGVKKLAVMCPSFVSDCLETLEEIGIRAKAQFLAAGGERLTAVPCLNSAPQWIDALHQLVLAQIGRC